MLLTTFNAVVTVSFKRHHRPLEYYWHDMTWRGVTWRDMTWHDMMWRGVTWRDVMWRNVTYVILNKIVLFIPNTLTVLAMFIWISGNTLQHAFFCNWVYLGFFKFYVSCFCDLCTLYPRNLYFPLKYRSIYRSRCFVALLILLISLCRIGRDSRAIETSADKPDASWCTSWKCAMTLVHFLISPGMSFVV